MCEKDVMNDLKSNLKALVSAKNISMAQLSRETGVPPQTLNNWLSGQEPRSLKQVRSVARFFNITVDELCFGDEKNSNQILNAYSDEINAGVFEVVLRRIRK